MNLELNRDMYSRAAPDSVTLACEKYAVPEPVAITVMVASDHKALRATWFSMLPCEAGIAIEGGSSVNAPSVAACVERHPPKVLLLDEALVGRLDQQSLRRIQKCCEHVRVLLLGDTLCDGLVDDVLRNRFNGLLLATCHSDVSMKAVSAIGKGDACLSREALAIAITGLLALPAPRDVGLSVDPIRVDASESLTPRERQVVALVRRGCINKEIACELGVAEGTVKKHLQSIFAKLGVHRRALVALGRRDSIQS